MAILRKKGDTAELEVAERGVNVIILIEGKFSGARFTLKRERGAPFSGAWTPVAHYDRPGEYVFTTERSHERLRFVCTDHEEGRAKVTLALADDLAERVDGEDGGDEEDEEDGEE